MAYACAFLNPAAPQPQTYFALLQGNLRYKGLGFRSNSTAANGRRLDAPTHRLPYQKPPDDRTEDRVLSILTCKRAKRGGSRAGHQWWHSGLPDLCKSPPRKVDKQSGDRVE